MKLKYILISLFVINTSIFANYLETSEKILDITYDTTDDFIYHTSNYLDKSFSNKNYKVENRFLSRAEIYYETVAEDGKSRLTNNDIKIRLLFPRLRHKYKVTFENYKSNESIDNLNDNNDYLVGVVNGKRRIGLKFRGISPRLFVSYKLSKDYNLYNNYNLYMENFSIYFYDIKFENTMQLNIYKSLGDDLSISFNNIYRFYELNTRHEIVHSFNINHQINRKEVLSLTTLSYSSKDDIINKDLEVDYYYAGLSYKNFFYKNRGYFQVDAGTIARDENGFDPKARVLFRIGALFGNNKPNFK